MLRLDPRHRHSVVQSPCFTLPSCLRAVVPSCRLCASSDRRVITHLPSLLGKTFYKSGPKRPIPVSLAPNAERVDGKRVKKDKKHALTPRIAPKDRGPAQVATPADAAREIEKALTATTVRGTTRRVQGVATRQSSERWLALPLLAVPVALLAFAVTVHRWASPPTDLQPVARSTPPVTLATVCGLG